MAIDRRFYAALRLGLQPHCVVALFSDATGTERVSVEKLWRQWLSVRYASWASVNAGERNMSTMIPVWPMEHGNTAVRRASWM